LGIHYLLVFVVLSVLRNRGFCGRVSDNSPRVIVTTDPNRPRTLSDFTFGDVRVAIRRIRAPPESRAAPIVALTSSY